MRTWMAMGLLLFSTWAHAQGAGSVRKQLEASLMVDGEITVDEKGAITEYSLKDPDKLPPGVEAFIRNNLSVWAFEPP